MKNLLPCLLILIFIGFDNVVPEETCHFPQFLQSSPLNGDVKPWSTRIWWVFIRHDPKWFEKQEIYVKNGLIWRHREQACDRAPQKIGRCTKRKLVYNRTCISEEGPDTFRVIQYNADRSHRFTCLKFIRRSDSVIQVYEGPLSDNNEKHLCDESKLSLDEWPWTGPWNNKPTFCPLSGGYSFRTIQRLTHEDFCETEWRWSHLEVECMKGDGMVFMAPEGSKCNPFLQNGDRKKLTCWAGWSDGDFIFIIASDVGRQPQYCLRFPRIQKGEFTVLVYFSVICPSESDGKPPSGIDYYELRMYRRDPYNCRNENEEKCQELITAPEICKNKTISPHCPEKCGKCSTLTDIKSKRCLYDPKLYGEWVLYDKQRQEDVNIFEEEFSISNFGTFHCLEKGPHNRQYKTATVFQNGCSPRYSCVEMNREYNNFLRYRISPSEIEDLNMDDLCIFRDDPYPLKDTFRSYYFKNLIVKDDIWPAHCGLDGVIPFNGTINGRTCQGSISTWDEDRCARKDSILLQSTTCKQLILPMEFQCIGFIKDDDIPLRRLILTRSMDGKNSFNCWVLTSYIGSAEWPWRVMFQTPTVQCSLLMEVGMTEISSSESYFRLNDIESSKICKPDERYKPQATQNDVTRSTEVSYNVPKQPGGGNKPENAKPMTNSPVVHPYQTETPYRSLYDSAPILSSFPSTLLTLSVTAILTRYVFLSLLR